MILLIDNYDSFSYNLMQLAGSIRPDIRVVRNDQISVGQIMALQPSHIIISPGPGHPKDAGVCEDIILEVGNRTPILGVCLGHQCICEAYGAVVDQARQLMHGKSSTIKIDDRCPIFDGMPQFIKAARYHSLAARKDTVPDQLQIVAEDDYGEVMAVKHYQNHIYGVQFHPESILTPLGHKIMDNFLGL